MNRFQINAVRAILLGSIASVGAGLNCPEVCSAGQKTRPQLKDEFQNGDIPTQDDFKDVLDSYLHLLDDGFAQGRAAVGPDGGAAIYGEGVLIDGSLPFGSAAGLSSEWAGQTGFMPISFSIGPAIHFGYLTVRSGAPGTNDLYPLQFQSLTYEDQAGTSLTTAPIPEPSTLALVGIGALALLARGATRRRAR